MHGFIGFILHDLYVLLGLGLLQDTWFYWFYTVYAFYKVYIYIYIYIYIYNKLKCFELTEMLLREKDPKGFAVQTSRNEFKTSIKNDDGQLRAKETIYIKKSKNLKKFNKKRRFGH